VPVSHDVLFSFLAHAVRVKLSLVAYHGLSLREFVVLALIATQGPATFKQLQELLAVSKSAITGMIDSLHARRLVERHQDPDDRRKWFVALTRPGERVVETLQEEDSRLLESAFESLEESEQAVFLKAAEAVHRELAAKKPHRPKRRPRARSQRKDSGVPKPRLGGN
jgi:DNA-binding MarR family transcriptional regulator